MNLRQRLNDIGASVAAWWLVHKQDEREAVTFVHKYPMQLIILSLALMLLVTCSHTKSVQRNCLPDFESTQTHAPSGSVAFSHVSISIPSTPERQYSAYSTPRADGALAFDISTSNVGTSELQDEATGDIVGTVYIDGAAQGIIVQVSNVYVGVH